MEKEALPFEEGDLGFGVEISLLSRPMPFASKLSCLVGAGAVVYTAVAITV